MYRNAEKNLEELVQLRREVENLKGNMEMPNGKMPAANVQQLQLSLSSLQKKVI